MNCLAQSSQVKRNERATTSCARVCVDSLVCVNEFNGLEWGPLWASSAYAKCQPPAKQSAVMMLLRLNVRIRQIHSPVFIYNKLLLNQTKTQQQQQKMAKIEWYPTDNAINTLRRHSLHCEESREREPASEWIEWHQINDSNANKKRAHHNHPESSSTAADASVAPI